MKAQLPIAALAVAVAATAATATAPAASGAPPIRQMVVFESGAAVERAVRARRARVRVKGERCAVAAATPLAALVRSEPKRLRLTDYGSCSHRPADGSGLFVKALGGEVNRGLDGWVYKVGTQLGTAGAADPAGPFGRGRLRPRQRVTWFYCVFDEGSCQRTLVLRRSVDGREVSLSVGAYDDFGERVAVSGASIVARRLRARPRHAGRRRGRGGGRRAGFRRVARTDAHGAATLTLPRGTFALHARKRGTIRSFSVRVRVR